MTIWRWPSDLPTKGGGSRWRFGGSLRERTKADGSLVTDADEAVEDALSSARSVVPFEGHLTTDRARQVARNLSRATPPSAPDEPAAALHIANGLIEAAVVFLCGPWDLAAPSIVVEEAGGRFSDLAGTRDLTTGTGLFTNGLIHDALLHELVSQRRRERM